MKLKFLILVFGFFCFTSGLTQNKEPDFTIKLIANDKIADVNVNQESLVKSIGKVSDYCKNSFKSISDDQKIGILVIVHKTGNPTYACYANPSIDKNLRDKVLKDLSSFQIENTKIVDFPFFISINGKNKDISADFPDYEGPIEKIYAQYKNADLQTKLKLIKEYAVNEVLPVLGAYQVIVDTKFEGVHKFGKLIESTNFTAVQNVDALTSKNGNYWRACMEMNAGNQIIPITKIAILVSQGELDYALKYIEMIRMYSDPKTIANDYLKEMNFRIALLNQELQKQIETGIAEHDKNNYDKAIEIYTNILKIYPNSSWTLYEKYFTENAKNALTRKPSENERADWDIAKVEIYKHNPLYNMDVRASNGKEAYLIFRRQEINSLFKKKEEKLKDVFKYAEIASDLGVYDFAAQLFWLTATFDKDAFQESVNNHLYCLDKLGEKQLKANFKGDFDKTFKSIEEAKEKEMKSSPTYKAMKNEK